MTSQASVGMDRRRHLLPEMEGMMARWYARQRGTPSQRASFREQASRLTASLPAGADVLEVAPGPGYHAIEMARLRGLHVTGLDISHTMAEIARENAAAEGVTVDFRQGDATTMPFADDSFDLIVCQAAFKNFRHPVSVLDEMHRVLHPGGHAVIQDMRREATPSDIAREIAGQHLSPLNAFVTKRILTGLRNRAYSADLFRRLVGESAFPTCTIDAEGIGLEVRLEKPA